MQDFKIELLDTCFERHRFIIEEYWWNKLFEEEYLMYDIKRGNSHSHNTKQRIALKRKLKDKDKYKEFTVDLYTHNILGQETFDDIRNNYSKDKRKDDFER